MRVIKRNGEYEDVSFDKVLKRIKVLSNDIDVNAFEIAQKVCSRIFDGVKTSELDELAAHMCGSMVMDHPDYGKLASRIIISNHHKNTSPSFSETVQILYENYDVDGVHCPLVSEELYDIVMKNKEKLNTVLDYSRDYLFDYFGFKTLERSYLMRKNGKVIERPQHMWMRVALGIHGNDFKDALQTYDLMSQKFFTHASPTLFNAGTPRPQNSSCFLLSMNGDALDKIYSSLQEVALISKFAGGIGIHMHQIRSKGSRIRGTNGKSDGLIPMLRVFNSTARYVNQGGRRAGSVAVYLEPWHADVESFIELRKNHGNEEERCRDLFLALWIPDLFMERVKTGGMWSLMCPDTCKGLSDVWGNDFKELYENYESMGRYVKQVKAQDLWFKIMEAQIEQGVPYMLFKDSANMKSNQQNIGTIKSSNLCVAGDTMIYTENGYYPIKELKDMSVRVWNGKEFSDTVVKQTGNMQKLITVKFSNGMRVRCTPYHKFYIETGTQPTKNSKPVRIDAKDLNIGMKIISYDLPCINTQEKEMKYAYTCGIFSADGTYANKDITPLHQCFVPKNTENDKCIAECGVKIPKLWLYGEKKNLLSYIDYHWMTESTENDRYNLTLPHDIDEKYVVPINYSIKTKLEWLAGLFDGDGCVVQNNGNKIIQVCSIHKEFLQNVLLLLQTLGVDSSIMLPDCRGEHKIYNTKLQHRLNISFMGVNKLCQLGLKTHRLNIDDLREPHNQNKRFVTITSIEDNDEYGDTFCFNEPKEHKGIFNGVIMGNCTEILEVSTPDETAVCNLSSICIPTFVEHDEKGNNTFNYQLLHDITKVITKNLNKVIDRNFYPVEKARKSNLRHRPIGIGVQGLADVFVLLRLPFESDEAKEVNKKIFETIYHGALESSMEIARKRHLMFEQEPEKADEYLQLNEYEKDGDILKGKYPGAYLTFDGSPASKGMLQFDLWGQEHGNNWDWDGLKQEIMKYGIRNSLLVAPMPTASTAQIMGFNESFEPFTSNVFKRKVLSGEFVLVNKYLINDLIRLGLWSKETKDQIIVHEGSIQNIPEIPDDIKKLYKTVWEIKQKNLVDMSADRGIYICQSQSLNIFMEDPDFQKLTSMHFYNWQKGLKTSSYYLRTRPRAKTQQFTIDPKLAKSLKNGTEASTSTSNIVCTDEVCTMCSS